MMTRPFGALRARGSAVAHQAAPLLLRLFVFSIMLPSEVSVRPFGLFLSPARLLLLIMAPIVVVRLSKMMGDGRYRFVWADLFVTLTGIWMLFSLSHSETVSEVLTHGGPMALEFCVTYFAFRTLCTGHGQALSLLSDLALGIGVVGFLGIADTVSGSFVWRDLGLNIFGGTKAMDAGYRLGLLRAMSTMDHPILFGFVCFVGLIVAAALPVRRRWFAICGCAVGLALALSSAPIQSALIGAVLFGYARMMTGVPYRWTALLSLIGVILLVITETISNPLGYVFNHLVFDAESAYYRMYIWQTATAVIGEKPWFGIGYEASVLYDIPTTVDSVWLVWSLTFGLPGAILLAASLIGSASLPTQGRQVRLSAGESQVGLALGIIIATIMFLGFTVHFFGEEAMLVPLIAGLRAHLGELGRRAAYPAVAGQATRPLMFAAAGR